MPNAAAAARKIAERVFDLAIAALMIISDHTGQRKGFKYDQC